MRPLPSLVEAAVIIIGRIGEIEPRDIERWAVAARLAIEPVDREIVRRENVIDALREELEGAARPGEVGADAKRSCIVAAPGGELISVGPALRCALKPAWVRV